MDWKKCGKFIMKVASDVLLLLCLHDFGLWVSVELGQASAFLYSEARLYKGPRQSPLPQLTATRSTGNISVRTESQPQQHTWTSEFFVLFPLKKITAALSLHFQHLL
jgi:hypothetical protein